MKKLISILMLGVALPVLAQYNTGFQKRDFLAGGLGLFITNNTTYTYGNSNYYYTNAVGAPVASLTNLYWTNAIGTGTLYTNANIGAYDPAWIDVDGFADKNGNAAAASIALVVTGSAATATNTLTFTFEKCVLVPGMPQIGSTAAVPPSWVAAGDTNDKFTLGFTNVGTTQTAIITNLPSTFMTGGGRIRLQTIVAADNGAATSYNIQALQLTGFIYPNN